MGGKAVQRALVAAVVILIGGCAGLHSDSSPAESSPSAAKQSGSPSPSENTGLLPSPVQNPSPVQDMVLIPEGTYTIGSDQEQGSAQPVQRIAVQPFLIGRHEVTNAEFAEFLNTLNVQILRDADPGRVEPSDVTGSDASRLFLLQERGIRTDAWYEMNDNDARIGTRAGRFYVSPGFENHPVNEVTWFGARAFAQWRGGRLPTEVEWEAAARGVEGRTFPWGNEPPTPERAVFGRGSGETAPVGTVPLGNTPLGLQDMSGNVAEWTSTLFRPYPYSLADGRETSDENGNGDRVTRGGDHHFDIAADELTTFYRNGRYRRLDRGHRHIGFRIVGSVDS
jgi:formylglycine-generating enzyme required for sulfatase activity